MPLVMKTVETSETTQFLPLLLDAEESEERLRTVLLDPNCTTYASWLDGQLVGATVVRWQEEETSEILSLAVVEVLRGQGYGKQILHAL
jgi:N-acetylglutamate synthase-like GNAT family acetyltransferase